MDPLCCVQVSHGGKVLNRLELRGGPAEVKFSDVLEALGVQAGATACKLVYRGRVAEPGATLADAGAIVGDDGNCTAKMILVGALQPSAKQGGALLKSLLQGGAAGAAPKESKEDAARPVPESTPPDAIALYDFAPQHARQLQLTAGELLDVLRSDSDDWWLVRRRAAPEPEPEPEPGAAPDRVAGWVPASYVARRSGGPAAAPPRPPNTSDSRANAIKRMLDRYQAERHSLSAALPDKVEVYSHVARYASAEPATAWRWLLSTLLLAAASSVLLVAMCLRWWDGGSAALGGGASSALLLPSALLLAALSRVKLFIMFHDCTHNALFGNRPQRSRLRRVVWKRPRRPFPEILSAFHIVATKSSRL